MTTRRWILALIMSGGLLAGCGRVPNTHYYTLMYPRPRNPAVTNALNLTLGIDRVLADSLHRQPQIIYYTPPNVVNLYFYERWATPLPEMLGQRLQEQFQAAGLFKQIVLPYRPGDNVDYVLRATIVRLAEVDEPAGARVVVELSAKLFDPQTGNAIWTGEGKDERLVSLKDMKEIVEAMNGSVEASVAQLIAGVQAALGHR